MKKTLRGVMLRFFMLSAVVTALPLCGWSATISITRSVTEVIGTPDTYIYTYSVFNDGSLPGMAPVQILDIYFDPTIFDENSLENVTPEPLNTEWLPQILFSVGDVPAAFDAESQNGGITAGNTVGGFAVQFTSLSPNLPSIQAFDIFDPANIAQPIFSGFTNDAGVMAPEPSTLSSALMALSLILVGAAWAVRGKYFLRPLRRRLGSEWQECAEDRDVNNLGFARCRSVSEKAPAGGRV